MSAQPPGATARRVRLLFGAALILRLSALLVLAPHRSTFSRGAWDFGHEAACLGQSLWLGHGFGDPWAHGTGPSSWLTPPYPALLATLMEVFGGIDRWMALTLFVLQSIASAATCALLVRLGDNLGARAAGWWGGILLALYPPGILDAVSVVWDTTFVAFGVVLCLALLTRPGAFARPSRVEIGRAHV